MMPDWMTDWGFVSSVLGAAVVAATLVLEPISRRTANKWDNKLVAFLHDVIRRFSLRLPPTK